MINLRQVVQGIVISESLGGWGAAFMYLRLCADLARRRAVTLWKIRRVLKAIIRMAEGR